MTSGQAGQSQHPPDYQPPLPADALQGCPCGSGATLQACCDRYHRAWAVQRLTDLAPDALALMRSRYTAYVFDRLDYLRATWHPDHRPRTLLPSEPGLRWLGLSIKSHRRIDDAHEEVEFVARSKLGGRAHRLHERSRFLRLDGRWVYVDGDLL